MNEPIKLDGKYKYRNGEPARVVCVDGGSPEYPVVSIMIKGYAMSHRSDGSYFANGKQSQFDLIPDVPLWEGEIWVRLNNAVVNNPSELSEVYMIEAGFRKIKVQEVEQCQS